ncbi:hypothetical protein VB735_13440 [Halotia wernerae UHCC 0503]|nr:hypothetical protein [Halotia wernerae UHCC 0503]
MSTTNSLIESNPNSGSAYFLRDMAYFRLKNVNYAMTDLKKSAHLFENNAETEKAKQIGELIKDIEQELRNGGENELKKLSFKLLFLK